MESQPQNFGEPVTCPSGCRPAGRKGVVKRGTYLRREDRAIVQRYQCRCCGRSFSTATLGEAYRQKKRTVNFMIYQLLASGVSQRRIAILLRINRKTVVRKFILIGQLALRVLRETQEGNPKVEHMQFDDMETFEHTKCKVLSITLAVAAKERRILGFRVSEMPAKGPLSQLAREKYGPRNDERSEARQSLFEEIQPLISEHATISSDKNPHYTADVKDLFPNCRHQTFKGNAVRLAITC